MFLGILFIPCGRLTLSIIDHYIAVGDLVGPPARCAPHLLQPRLDNILNTHINTNPVSVHNPQLTATKTHI